MIKTPLSTVIGGAFWTPGAVQIGSSSKDLTQIIKSLFSLGEQGFAYNPNDLTTLYQDAAGTIPVAAAGQPVGLMLDKSSHLQESAELNPDTHFKDSAKWTLNRASVDGGKLIFTDAITASTASISGLTVLGKWYKITVTVDSISGQLRVSPFAPNYTPTVNFNISAAGTYTAIMQAEAAADPSLFVRTVGASTSAIVSFLSIKELSGNHAYQTVSASRPILQRNATTGAYYLTFDGVDDFLQTNNIDFTATDKVSLFAGLRKLSDSILGIVVETGTNYSVPTGGFALFAPFSTAPTFGFGVSGGNVAYNQGASGYEAPRNLVTSLRLDLSATDRPTQVKFNIDGAWKVIATGSTATGGFANTPIYIGRRAGTSLPFNGHLYGLIGIGRLTTDSETIALEKVIAKNTGVALNV